MLFAHVPQETHNKYIESNPDAQIGLSKFCELRPKPVKLFDHVCAHIIRMYGFFCCPPSAYTTAS